MSNTHSTSQSQNSQKSQKSENAEQTHDTTRSETEDRRPTLMEVLREARSQLAELTGLVPETVSSFEQTEDGWSLEVEVMELARVPDTMSLMASYQVDLDPEGQLTGYRRVRRYERGRADARRGG
ncbi:MULTISPECIES: gas vesicle protein [Streptomyces]|uniref:Gas vesicle protein n=2 Tax=Streptomyces TaxID=1883 RepID=A0A101QKV8_STRCK|nr:gas vesicle protein [Streptomyces corchorusii]AEY92724.1 gas vesicle synthesis protein [Streptomyces hygroscopicus subsp. jinggangensis 5008]ALO97372.1 Gas vesicle synthesis protein GvpO [Streptomyces hygroscopicus subsp. limoneus]KUN31684.1 gas vesicle protein [Streptomyces corchorusii]